MSNSRQALGQLFLSIIVMMLTGCGSGSDGGFASNLNPSSLPMGDGEAVPTGSILLRTQLEASSRTLGQQIQTFESVVVPSIVDQFRVTGVDVEGERVLGPLLFPKASELLIEAVPVTTVKLRVELLVEQDLVVGAFSQSVAITAGETLSLESPTYVFTILSGEPGFQDPPDLNEEMDGPGPSGPQTVPGAAYGSFVYSFVSANEPNTAVDFQDTLTSKGVERAAAGQYTVSLDGDYLVTWKLDGLVFPPNTYNNSLTLHINTDAKSETVVTFLAEMEGDSSLVLSASGQFIVSLTAGDSLSLMLGDRDPLSFVAGSLTIIRIGP